MKDSKFYRVCNEQGVANDIDFSGGGTGLSKNDWMLKKDRKFYPVCKE